MTATAAPQPGDEDPKRKIVDAAVKDALKRKPAPTTATQPSKPAAGTARGLEAQSGPDSVIRYLEGRIVELEDRLRQAELIITTYGQLSAQLTQFTAEIFNDPTALDTEPA